MERARLLFDYLQDIRRQELRLRPGRFDCALYAAEWVRRASGRDLAQDWRGTYRSLAQGRGLLAEAGIHSLGGLAAKHLPELRGWRHIRLGDVAVIDLDGEELTEKTAARKWGYVFTPTIVFLPEAAPEGGTTAESAVATMPGSFGKWTFLNMFRWVNEKGYESDEHFQKYHARIINELREEGRLGGN